jgi:Ca2+-binding RTX toxin-like protein
VEGQPRSRCPGAATSAVPRRQFARATLFFSALLIALAFVAVRAPASPAGTVQVSASTLSWTGGSEDNNVLFREFTPGTFTVWDTKAPLTVGPGCTVVDASTATCPTAGIARITALAGDGDDGVDAGSIDVPVSIDGGYGSDSIQGGDVDDTLTDVVFFQCCIFSAYNDTIDGNGGNDVIDGGSGEDVLRGGEGNDTLTGARRACNNGGVCLTALTTLNGEAGNDLLVDGRDNANDFVGGTGDDTASYEARTGDLSISLDDVNNDGDGDNVRSDVERVIGGSGNDLLVGRSGLVNTLEGRGGDDVLDGGAFACGRGCAFLRAEPDSLLGGTGSNTARYAGHEVPVAVTLGAAANGSADENDILVDIQNVVGGTAGDTLTGNALSNAFTGGPGNDALNGAGGLDRVAESGDVNFTLTDSSLTGAGTDALTGIEEATLIGGASDNLLLASAFSGSVRLEGAGGGDQLTGGAGSDTLLAGEGHDFLFGNGGNDDLRGAIGSDQLYGGNGADTLDGAEETDVLTGGAGDDQLAGGAGNNILREEGDVDFTLTDASLMGLGSDALSGFASVQLSGGPGNNTLDASAATMSTSLAGFAGNDTLRGGSGSDYLSGYAGDDVLQGGDSIDGFEGGPGNDLILGGAGLDHMTESGSGDFTLTDTSLVGTDPSSTGSGTDTIASMEQVILSAGVGANTMNAGGFAGKVTLVGGPGDDVLTGAGGDDYLNGGDGVDRVIASGDVDFTLTDVRLTGRGVDQLGAIERVTLSGGASPNAIDASAFTAGSVTLEGGGGSDLLIGGPGNDLLGGGAGADSFLAGGGDDAIATRDGVAEPSVSCGVGADSAVVDAADTTNADCEQVDRPDVVAPSTPSELGQTAMSETSVSVSWTASSDNVSVTGYEVFVGSAMTMATATTSSTLGGLACGQSYLIGVEALDAAGNRSTRGQVSASTSVCPPTPPPPPPPPPLPPPPPTLDRTAPNTTLVGGPRGRVRARTARFAFAATEPGSRFACKLDRGRWTSCRSPKGYRALKRGPHVFLVRATDAAGNVDLTPARRAWRVR